MNDQEEAERKADERRLQFEMFSLEDNRKQLEGKRNRALAEIKRLKTAIAHLEIDRHDQETVLATLEQDIATMTEDGKQLKKKMNAL